MKQFSRRELREKLQKEHRRYWGLSSAANKERHPTVTLWESPRRSKGWKWIAALLTFWGGLALAFAAGLGVGYLWTTR